MRQSTFAMVLGSGLSFAALSPGHAGVIYSTGFESPDYTTGALAGQDGWDFGTGIVETQNVFAGNQAVGYDSTGLNGQRVDQRGQPFAPAGPVALTDEILVSVADPNVQWEALTVYGNTGFLAQVTVANGMANFGTVSTIAQTPFAFGVWNQVSMTLDFATQTATAYLNGSEFGSAAFATASSSFSGFGIGINFANGGATSQSYFDNLSVVEGTAAPELSTWAMVVVGFAGICLATAQRSRTLA
jgi:hypothetical protein